jgi:cytochrome c oxidase subunit IV
MIKKHYNHIILGIGMIMIGIWLIMNDRFFTWPPDTVEFANDDIWGGIFIIIGFSLLVWVIDGQESVKWNRRLLAIAAGAIAFLTAYQFMIWAVTGEYHSWISNAIITAFVLIMARRSDTKNDQDIN